MQRIGPMIELLRAPVTAVVTAVTVLIALMPSTVALSAQCLQYEPDVVLLRGMLVKLTFPGPPNYASIERGDMAEPAFYLDLEHAICVDARDEDSPNMEAASGVTRVQIGARPRDRAGRPILLTLLRKPVLCRGTLFHAFTGHHHTPVLMTVQSCEAG